MSGHINEINLADAVEFIVDNRGRTAPINECGIPLIATNCVSNEQLYPSKEKLRYVSQETYENWFRSHPNPDDILLTNKGSQNGAVCLVPDPVDFCIAQDMVALRADPNKIYPLYLFAVLRSSLVQNRIKELNVDSVIPHFKKTDFNKLYFPLPDVKEQKFIGDLYFKLSYKVELNRQINQTLEAMAQAIFKSWFVDFEPVKAKIAAIEADEDAEGVICATMRAISGKTDDELDQLQAGQPEHYAQLKTTAELFPSAMQDSELGEVPEGWTPSSIGAEFNATMGQSPPGNTYNENGEGEPFFQGRRDFGWRYPENRVYCTQPKRMAKKGDTLLSVRAPVGDVNKAITDCCIGRGVAALRHKLGCEAYTYYSMMDLSRSFKSFDSEGTVFGSINQKDLKALKVVKPSNIIVEAFTHTIEVIDHQILNLDDQVRVLAKIRDTLLPKLLSGELSVDAAKLAEEN
jgi:type I restriction enzyme S subunit